MKRVFTHANIVDVENNQILEGKAIMAEDDRIAAIHDDAIPENCTIVDLKGKYVIPGLFNCHTHMVLPYGHNPANTPQTNAWGTIVALDSLSSYIKTGCTFVRDVGDFDFISVDIRDAVKQGWVKCAPDIQSSGRPICMTGGSAWRGGMGYQADGPEECRKAARFMLRSGVDWVKLMATGGTATLGNKCAAPQLDEIEIHAAVVEAHKAGKKVVCHAQGIEGAKNAIRAGVDSLEHGFELDDECIELMLKKGTWLCPTLSASYEIKQRADKNTPREFVEKAMTNVSNVFKTFPKAYRAGIPCAAGTDCGSVLSPHTNTCEELLLMVELGLSAYEALIVGTLNSAKLCGVDGLMGSITVGKKANFAVYADNPVADIKTLRNCLMTVKNGEVLWCAPEC